jgi:putative acetyltransferase
MPVAISQERPDSPEAAGLILELEAHLASLYPSTSRHGFSVERLVAEKVDFFVLRSDGVPAGCGGILFVDDEYGEIKRMYVRSEFRGQGLGARILAHLTRLATSRGTTLLRLETGIHQREAISLYEREGFHRIPPFGPYTDDPLTLCYEKQVAEERHRR